MTSNRERADRLEQTLHAFVAGHRTELESLLTPDVRTWAPEWAASTRDELLDTFDRRDDAFADASIDVVPLDVGGDHAGAEWTLRVRHVGPIELTGGETIGATHASIEINGVTIAEFDSDLICALRQYWNVNSLLEQLAAAAADDAAT